MTVQFVQDEIRRIKMRFNALKKASRECLEKLRIPLKSVTDALILLPADDADRRFLNDNLTELYQATDHSQQFSAMKLYWNYQNYQLLDGLIQEFDLEEMKDEMQTYKEDLQQFRKKTPLRLFCQSQWKCIKQPPCFHEVVAECCWPDDVTVGTVQEFQAEYADHYNLQKYAMMLAVVLPGSFLIKWFIPDSIVEKLKVKVPREMLKSYSLTKLEIAGECIYHKDISGYTQPHLYYNDIFSGVCFLGEPLEYFVTSKQVIISPQHLGITLDIPSGAVPPGECVPVTIRPCLFGPFQYPEGYEPLSAVYHISAISSFKKKATLKLEHFGDLQTKEQADEMTFFSAKSSPVMIDGKEVYPFGVVKGGEFQMGGKYGTISLEHFCFTGTGRSSAARNPSDGEDSCPRQVQSSAGDLQVAGVEGQMSRKCYIVLQSHTEEMTHGRHAAAIAVSVQEKVYIENFRKALETEWGVPFEKGSKINLSFRDSTEGIAMVQYPPHLEGWNILPHCKPCDLPQKEVDYARPDLPMYDYPPRVKFTMLPSESAETCAFWLKVTGMNREVNFHFFLNHPRSGSAIPHGHKLNRPRMEDLLTLETSEGRINIIEESANIFKDIGTILLDANKVTNIAKTEKGNPVDVIREIYRQWMQKDEDYSWKKLTQCLRRCDLNVLASQIEKHFGLPSD